ncbi:hypothetical protein CTI12_AA298760 [Artemisia annua]|uniref:Uncharacterized protein n=1 Tax=Artemisia annua TaxID=35608 RepID=A0A2U1N770_ARTAN|nr:hypothetical protein CTI12_AA298760 [Artemisia annua]
MAQLKEMNDWAAPILASALFAFLAPGLVFQMPGNESPIGFMNMKTSIHSGTKVDFETVFASTPSTLRKEKSLAKLYY